jgi:hypothetical protein
MNSEDVNKLDWSKIFMAFFVGLTFLMQQYHAMQLADVKSTVAEHTVLNDEMEFNQENRKKVFKDIDRRLKALEALAKNGYNATVSP